MRPRDLITIAAGAAIAVLCIAILQHQATPAPTEANSATSSQTNASAGSPTSASGTSQASASAGYTMAQVAQHNSAASCWAAINGNVYDLTAWINQHPGGPEHILALCGTDGSAAFNAQHGGQEAPQQELKNFYIGPLAS